MIFWFTGQPGSGKTTLGKALLDKLNDAFHMMEMIYVACQQIDYSEQGRINNIRTAQSIAMFLDNKGKDVVVSVVAPYKWLEKNSSLATTSTKYIFTLQSCRAENTILQKIMRF